MPENSATRTGSHIKGQDWQAETLKKVQFSMYPPFLMKISHRKLHCNFHYLALGCPLMLI